MSTVNTVCNYAKSEDEEHLAKSEPKTIAKTASRKNSLNEKSLADNYFLCK
jgi:hypothetical protein